jgi:hypothetical protein
MIDPTSEILDFQKELYNQALNQQTAGRRREDVSLRVRFFTDDVEDVFTTEKTGAVSYRRIECIEIIPPGLRVDVVVREVTEDDKIRFKTDYEVFKSLKDKKALGLALEDWAVTTKRVVADCNRVGIYTVEQLAQADEKTLLSLGADGKDYQKRAKLWLETQREATASFAILKKLEASEIERKRLEEVVLEMQKKIEKIKDK